MGILRQAPRSKKGRLTLSYSLATLRGSKTSPDVVRTVRTAACKMTRVGFANPVPVYWVQGA
jgi:hypothetical protein